jgi:peptidyl-tRNA hydrolase
MPLTNSLDTDDLRAQRAGQTDPLVQYIVVRRERVPSLPLLLASVAQAVAIADHRFSRDDNWAESVEAWRKGSFRKVTLRANEKDWPKLLSGHIATTWPEVDPYVAVLPPRPRSEVGRFLSNLQAYTIDAAALPDSPAPAIRELAMVIAPNPQLASMSVGKLAAQIGHAVLLCSQASIYFSTTPIWSEAGEAWAKAGRPVVISFPGQDAWQQAWAGDNAIVVTDAGFTEIAAGSQTVLALRPARGEELKRNLALLSPPR